MKIMPGLFEDYKKFEDIMSNCTYRDDSIDTSKYPFLAPTTLIPLLCEIERRKINKIITNEKTHDYVKLILNKEKTSTTTPYTILPVRREMDEDNELAMNMAKLIGDDYGGLQTRYHILMS
jgi:hypothetical protein